MNEHVGRVVSWFALIMVLMQFTVVLLRYVFGLGFIPMQESVLFMPLDPFPGRRRLHAAA